MHHDVVTYLEKVLEVLYPDLHLHKVVQHVPAAGPTPRPTRLSSNEGHTTRSFEKTRSAGIIVWEVSRQCLINKAP